MKTAWFKVLTIALLLTLPTLGVAQTQKTRTGTEKTLVGYISDDSCGLQHTPGMDEVTCTLACAKNGKFVLADRAHKLVYNLDKTGQEKAREFAGMKVKVRGRLSGKTMRVTSI
ncbi:MAG TPA: hypothetical protein VKB46_16665, partial [Pyrinomonadaceae bacterium]|nr:hypothetical protein [Pyrinomonadaceae bacterium]